MNNRILVNLLTILTSFFYYFNFRNSFWNKMSINFKEKVKVNGYLVLDMQPIFQNHFKKYKNFFEFKTDGHWNDLAHLIIHKSLLNFFDRNNLLDAK